jgi:autotransporter-associated beta strand protein
MLHAKARNAFGLKKKVVYLAAAHLEQFDAKITALFANTISGPSGLTKVGTSVVTLAGSNAFKGDTNLAASSDTLVLSNTNAPNSTLNYTGSTLTFSSSVTSHAFTVGGLQGSAGTHCKITRVLPIPWR